MFREIMGIDNFLAGSKVDIAKHWMIRSAVRPDECVYFGDTLADYSTAKAIGVENIILVASGHQSYTRLAQVCPSVIHSLKEYKVLLNTVHLTICAAAVSTSMKHTNLLFP